MPKTWRPVRVAVASGLLSLRPSERAGGQQARSQAEERRGSAQTFRNRGRPFHYLTLRLCSVVRRQNEVGSVCLGRLSVAYFGRTPRLHLFDIDALSRDELSNRKERLEGRRLLQFFDSQWDKRRMYSGVVSRTLEYRSDF